MLNVRKSELVSRKNISPTMATTNNVRAVFLFSSKKVSNFRMLLECNMFLKYFFIVIPEIFVLLQWLKEDKATLRVFHPRELVDIGHHMLVGLK